MFNIKGKRKFIVNKWTHFNFLLFSRKYLKFVLKFILPNIFYKKAIKYRKKIIFNKILRGNKKIIIVFPILIWNSRWQRPQQIISRLAKRGNIIVNINLLLKVSNKEYKSEDDCVNEISLTEIDKNLYGIDIFSKTEFSLNTEEMSKENYDNLFFCLSWFIKNIKIKNPTYFVQYPVWSDIVFDLKKKHGGHILFDYMDDHSEFSTAMKSMKRKEDDLQLKSDLIVASSQSLKEKAERKNKNVFLIRNGTEFDHFKNTFPNGKLDNLKGPIVGYYGAINDWFDADIICYCATHRPTWNFVLIGGTDHPSFEYVKNKIINFSNVLFLGEQPYNELPGYLYYFDVCIIPFKLIPLIIATNPVKFYEYISAGKPVVSVKLPELDVYKDCYYPALTKEDFLNQLDRAYIERDEQELIKKRIKLASKNSWDSRCDDFVRVMSKLGA